MKHFILIASFLLSAIAAQAQTYLYPATKDFKGYLTTGTASGDSLTNTTTKSIIVALGGAKNAVSWSVDVTKVSGTLGGYIQYFGSANDTSFFTTPFHVDTLTNTASQVSGTYYTGNPFSRVLVKINQSGTTRAAYALGGTWRNDK